jgi:23S rRNA (pseudouridine1915-N3)-methyltransferase
VRIHLLAVGTRRPRWERDGFEEYARRMPRECTLVLHEIPLGKRGAGASSAAAVAREGERMLERIPRGSHVIALDETGTAMTTRQLSTRLAVWMQGGRDLCLLVGGPDGLSAQCQQAAESSWSLSPLTLPHGMVRILVAEALYRALSLLRGHPYHRD